MPLLTLSACGDDGSGIVEIRAYGEEFVEQGIASEDMDDGWTINFERLSVRIAGFSLGDASLPSPSTVDLTTDSSGQGQLLGMLELDEGTYQDATYLLGPIEVVGAASRDGVTKRFEWRFEAQVRYDLCETVTEVDGERTSTFEITVHADHLFFDSLVSEEPSLFFTPLADTDANGDGNLEVDELAAVDIGSYDPGSEGGINDLWAWLEAQMATLGHVDGESHCRAQTVDSSD